MSTTPPILFVALDLPAGEAVELAEKLKGIVDGVKVGSTLFAEGGPSVVNLLQAQGHQLFLDLKLHDIPHQVGLACERLSELGADLMTIHTAGGEAMMRAAVKGVEGSETRLVGVTVLTSMDAAALAEVGVSGSVESLVLARVRAAVASGLSGVVASAREVRAIRGRVGEGFDIVTPGIRMKSDGGDDQVRVMSPEEAVEAGSNILVVGRPITQASDPLAAARAYMKALRGDV